MPTSIRISELLRMFHERPYFSTDYFSFGLADRALHFYHKISIEILDYCNLGDRAHAFIRPPFSYLCNQLFMFFFRHGDR